MSDFDNTNKGTLFINTKRQKETHPTMKGSINIDGKEYWLSAWAKVHETKGKWLSLSVEPKESEPADSSVPPVDDDLPF